MSFCQFYGLFDKEVTQDTFGRSGNNRGSCIFGTRICCFKLIIAKLRHSEANITQTTIKWSKCDPYVSNDKTKTPGV